MSKAPINNKILTLDSIQSELQLNGLNFLEKEISAIQSYDYSLFNSTSIDLNSFCLDLYFPDISEDTLSNKIQDLIDKTSLEDLINDIIKRKQKLETISKRKIDSTTDFAPFAFKIYRVFENKKSSKNCINAINFNAYKTTLPLDILKKHQDIGLKKIKLLYANDLVSLLSSKKISLSTFETILFPSYLTLHLENYVLNEITSIVSVESLDFLNNNYSTATTVKKSTAKKSTAKKTIHNKNTKSKNPFLNNYIFSCELEGKFLGIDFEVAGKLENKKLSFAAEFVFNKQEQNVLSIDELKSNFTFDLTNSPSIKNSVIEDEVYINLYYNNNSIYAIAQYSAFQIHLGFGKKKFLITQFNITNDNSEDYKILKEEFGLKNIFLLIQDPGALSENNTLLTELKKQFNIKIDEDEDEDEDNHEINKNVLKFDNSPFEKKTSIELHQAKYALAAQLENNLNDKSENKGLVPSIMDFIGAEKIDFYGVYKEKNQKELFLYIDKIGNPDRFFSVSDFSIKWFKTKDNTGFEGRANLNFKIEEDPNPFTIKAKAGFSKKSMYFGGEINREIKISDNLIIKKAAATIGFSRRTRSTTFGIAGMIQGLCTDDKTIFNFQGATSFSVLGTTIRPTLIAAATTSSNNDGITLADFIHGATDLDLSFVPTLALLKIQDIELTKYGVKIDEALSETNKKTLSLIDEEEKLSSAITSFNNILPFEEFKIQDDFSITELGNTKNYLVTDKTKMIHYKITNTGGINLISQFYACIEETTIGTTTYTPGFFVAGQLEFLGQKARFLFDINKENKTFTAALTLSPIKILGGLLEFKYFDNKVKNSTEIIDFPGSLKLFSNEGKQANERGPIIFCSYGGSIDTLKMYMNAELSLFWGFSKIQTELKIQSNQLEAYINYNFAIFKTNLIYKADVETFGKGNFYLKLDLEVESLNKKIKNLADESRKKADDAKSKLDASLKNLINKETEKQRIFTQINNINNEINRLTGWGKLFKRAALEIEKGLKYIEYSVICVAVAVLESAVTVLKAAINTGSAVVSGVLDAAAWVVEKIGQIFSIDSLVLEIDYRTNAITPNGNKINFKAEADYTILGQKVNPKLDLKIDFNYDIFDQILNQVSSKAKSIKEAIDNNNGALPDEYKKEEIKTSAQKNEIVEEIKILDTPKDKNIINTTTVAVKKHNEAIDNLYTLLIQNDFAKHYIKNGPVDADDIIFWEMAAMQERIETLPKDNFIHQLGVVFSGKEFKAKRTDLNQNDNKELSSAINTMFNQIDQLNDSLKEKNTVKNIDLSKVSTEKQLRREFIKYYNEYMNEPT